MMQVMEALQDDFVEDESEISPNVPNRFRGRAFGRVASAILPVCFVLLILGAWQLFADMKWVNPVFTSDPYAIVLSAYHMIPTDVFLSDLRVSATEWATGLALSATVGITLGLLMGWYAILERVSSLALNMFYSMPLIALAPIFVIWFGIGLESKVAIVFLGSIFPVLLSTMTGVKNADPIYIDLARSFNATRLQLWRTVVLPGAVPSIITGLRLAMVASLVAMVVGEFIAANAGLGYLISLEASSYNITGMFVPLAFIACFAAGLTFLLGLAERHFNKWRL